MASFEWTIDHQVKRVNINGDLIFLESRKIRDFLDDKLPENEKITFNFSAGWLAKFKALSGLRVLSSH